MFDDKARRRHRATRSNGFGDRPRRPRRRPQRGDRRAAARCSSDLEPVARNLADPQTRLGRFFQALGDAAAEVAPVAETQADAVREPGHHLHRARRRSRGRSSRSRSPRARRARSWRSASSRSSARSCATTPRFFRELRPGRRRRCRTRRRSWPTRFEAGTETLPKTPAAERASSADVFESAGRASPRTRWCARASSQLTRLTSLAASRRWRSSTPVQTTCNYATLFFRNAASLLSEGDAERHLAALHHRRPTPLEGPNNEGGPSQRPGERARATTNHLHAQPLPEHRVARARRASARRATSATASRPDDRSATARATRAPRPSGQPEAKASTP